MKIDEKIKRPPFLYKGDKVALISPAYWLVGEAISQAAMVLAQWGLVPVIGQNVNSTDANAYAGTADERADDLRRALEDDDIKAIVCVRGGYGCIHLLERITLQTLSEHPKWLIGHGDITTLLNAEVAAGVMAIHGPMALQIGSALEPSSGLLRNILSGWVPQYEMASHRYNHLGYAEGILVGGNLTSIASLSGSKFFLAPERDIILFIEELEEPLHCVDRFFYMLLLQGVLDRVKGIILGEFNAIRHDIQYESVEQMLTHHLRQRQIPICCGLPVGSNNCLPLIEGAPVKLEVTEGGARLTFDIEGHQQAFHTSKMETQLLR